MQATFFCGNFSIWIRKKATIVSEETFSVQTIVIGAGVVGLAIARRLVLSGREVLLVEAGPRIGEGISSRNSEVIHAGIYYPRDSLKARLCVRGRQQLYDFAASHGVGVWNCGKWIVASTQEQAQRLQAIRSAALDNGVQLSPLNGPVVEQQVPGVRACAGLWSPDTGIIDSHGLMLALLGDFQDAGGLFAVNSPVTSAETGSDGHTVWVGGKSPARLQAQEVVNAAGLQAPAIARQWQGLPDTGKPRQWLARGVYFSYSGRHPFSSLVYPLPEPGGLGVHLTLDLARQARFGPDVEWIDTEDYAVNLQRRDAFIASIRQWWPALEPQRLQPAYAGIRPKLAGPDGGFMDFRIDAPSFHGLEGLVNLFGIESPGLTSCLALADEVADRLAS